MNIDFTGIRGVGPSTAKILKKSGFNSVEDLASASIDDIMAIPGFRQARASQVIASAKLLMTEAGGDQPVKEKPKKKIKVKKKKKDSKKSKSSQKKKNPKKNKAIKKKDAKKKGKVKIKKKDTKKSKSSKKKAAPKKERLKKQKRKAKKAKK